MNKFKKSAVLMAVILLSTSLVACKKNKENDNVDKGETNVATAEEQENDSILRPQGTIKPNASTISLFIKTYNDNKDKNTNESNNTSDNSDTTGNEVTSEDDKNTEPATNGQETTDNSQETIDNSQEKPSDGLSKPSDNSNNVNPGGIVPETTDQSSIDLPYGGNPQAVKEKAAADAKEDEGKFELRPQEKLKEGKDDEKK